MLKRLIIALLLVAPVAAARGQTSAAPTPVRPSAPTVLFVCEHGTVKSLIAKLLFERYAAEVGLAMRALSRGSAADPTVPTWMQAKLVADSFQLAGFEPRMLAATDLVQASYVVSFDLAPSVTAAAPAPRAQWDALPAASDNYAASRDAIAVRVRRLVDSLKTASTTIVPSTKATVGAKSAQHFTNARWFDGTTFKLGDRYVVDGVFTSRRPPRIDKTTDLKGAFVVPPFAEAHSHNVESTRFDAVAAMHLKAGVFYVKNPNSLRRFTTPILGRINLPTGIDVTFANGGLTGPGGHPVAIAQRQITRGAWTDADGEGGFYWIIDDIAMLDAKWPRIIAGQPDFIKTYLLYSEEYEKRRTDSTYRDWRGLNPALLPEIVRRAHTAGKRVSTHVETAQDFRNAVAAGVDEINHLPGFRPDRNDTQRYGQISRYQLTDDDARRAARARTTVVTTVGGVVELLARVPATSEQAPLAEQTRAMLRENLRVLQRSGVRIAVGSDEYSRTADFETEQLAALHAVDNLTLLKWWGENSPATIFPKRKLGKLANGFEASFLVLGGNPLDDFANTRKITMRVKQGVVIP